MPFDEKPQQRNEQENADNRFKKSRYCFIEFHEPGKAGNSRYAYFIGVDMVKTPISGCYLQEFGWSLSKDRPGLCIFVLTKKGCFHGGGISFVVLN
jgi:hypothetical protein